MSALCQGGWGCLWPRMPRATPERKKQHYIEVNAVVKKRGFQKKEAGASESMEADVMDNSTKANRALKPAASACRVASIRLPVQNLGTHGRSAGRTAISSNAKLYSSNANLHPPNQAASTRDQTQKPTASARRVTPTTPPDFPVRNSGMYSCPTSCTVISSNAKLLAPTEPPAQQPLSSTLLSDTTVTDAYDVALPATDSDAATLPVLRLSFSPAIEPGTGKDCVSSPFPRQFVTSCFTTCHCD